MNRRVKKLPRLWCALQGLLPLEACLAAQRGELAWPEAETPRKVEASAVKVGKSQPRGAVR